MDPYVCDRGCRANWGRRRHDRRSSKFGNLDVDLRNLDTTQRDCYGMPTRIARLGFHRRVIFVDAIQVAVRIRQLEIVMLV